MRSDRQGQRQLAYNPDTMSSHPAKPRAGAFPADRTSFVGRAEELAALADRVRRDRLVTVLGPPGAGKTRLAARFAASWRGAGVIVVPLADARRLADILRAAAAALDVPLAGETSASDLTRLGSALAERGRCLVILDNVEPVASETAHALETWLDQAPRTRFVCTSRQRLGLTGESCLLLAGMAPEQARALFLERARLVTETTSFDDGVIDELVERLDRLPLAIELAASRAGALSPKQLLGALERRFELLQAATTDLPPRQATLRAAIDLSWALLPTEDQRALARLAVARGPFSLAAAAALLGAGEIETLERVEALRERSLLFTVPMGGDELGFALYESVREYAAERLPPADAVDAEDAHARHYTALGSRHASALMGATPRDAVRGLAQIHDQLLAAHRRVRDRDPALAIEAALAACALLVRRGPYEIEKELYADALTLAERTGAQLLVARVLAARGRSCVMRGLFLEARPDLERARVAARDSNDREAEALAVYLLSAAWREAGDDPAKAHALADEALALAQAAGRDELVAWCVGSVAAAAGETGDLTRSLELHGDAVARHQRLGQTRGVALTLGNLALVQQRLGRFDEARATNAEAIRLCDETGDEVLKGKILWTVARLSFDAGLVAEADAQLVALDASARRTGDRELVAQILLERARRSLVTGNRESGHAWLAKATAPVRACGAPRLEREFLALGALSAYARQQLRADPAGSWFERPGVGRVDLARRRSLRLLFAALLGAHVAKGGALSVDALVAAGWPGEQVMPESGAMRVWTAIRTLRRLGLAGVLVSRDGGYVLDPDLTIELA